jgi:hypothetical protein
MSVMKRLRACADVLRQNAKLPLAVELLGRYFPGD